MHVGHMVKIIINLDMSNHSSTCQLHERVTFDIKIDWFLILNIAMDKIANPPSRERLSSNGRTTKANRLHVDLEHRSIFRVCLALKREKGVKENRGEKKRRNEIEIEVMWLKRNR